MPLSLVGRTGLAWSPMFADYDAGPGAAFVTGVDFLPNEHWDTGKRVQCLYDILHRTGLADDLLFTEFDAADRGSIEQFHTSAYIDATQQEAPTGLVKAHDVALLAVGAVRQIVRRIWERKFLNGYALVRPAGHHANRDSAGGGCVYANGVFAAFEARRLGAERILLLDWDAHHGNSQQGAFWCDDSVLTISIHQAQKSEPGTSGLDARGDGAGLGFNVNVPLPAGCGTSAYRTCFETVVLPAAARFQPDFVIVSCGFDGNNIDPSSRLRLHSKDYHWMTTQAREIAETYAHGRLAMLHEGGYALPYIPLCFLRVIEALSDMQTDINDPFLERWGEDLAGPVNHEASRVLERAAELAAAIPRFVTPS